MSDCINRAAAIGLKTIAPIAPVINGETVHYEEVVFVRDLEKLPSVDPEREPGKRIRGEAYPHHIYCSECYKTFIPNDEFRVWANGDIPRKYCPECGAPMEVKTDHS